MFNSVFDGPGCKDTKEPGDLNNSFMASLRCSFGDTEISICCMGKLPESLKDGHISNGPQTNQKNTLQKVNQWNNNIAIIRNLMVAPPVFCESSPLFRQTWNSLLASTCAEGTDLFWIKISQKLKATNRNRIVQPAPSSRGAKWFRITGVNSPSLRV